MMMTNEEIVRDYMQAANKSKQIKILADLNAVSPGEIRAVLAEAGVEGVTAPKRIMPHKLKADPSPAPEAVTVPVAEILPQESIYCQIEWILSSIHKDAPLKVRNAAMDLISYMFWDYLEQRLGRNVPHDTR